MARRPAVNRRHVARVVALVAPALLAIPLLSGTALAKNGKTGTPVITSKPASPTTATSATFAFTDSTPGATLSCQLDSGAASPCTSPSTYSGLAGGTHRFSVRAQAPGKPASNWVRYSWSIDVTPPAAPTVSAPPSPTSSTSVSISFSDSDATTAGFTCSLDGGAASACTSPYAASGLAEGGHSLAVTARDAVGNGATTTVTWVVDHTAPAVPVVTGAASPTNSTSASILFTDSASDVASYTCGLDSEPAVTCTSPWSIAGPLAEGTHTVTVSAIDAVGNATSGRAQWVVDVTAPSTPFIQTGPASPTNQTGADFAVTENDPSGALQCSLDGGAWTACTSPVHEDVVQGAHTLDVRAIDDATNASSVASWSWTVDTTAPAPATITGGPTTPSNDVAPAFYFEATDSSANGFLCSLDGAAFADCDSGDAFAVAGDGQHTLSVENLDTASNVSSPATYTWMLDTTAPSVPLFVGSTPGITSSTSASFAFDDSESGVAFTCSLDGAPAAGCTSPYTTSGLGEGSHSFAVSAVDTAGNTSEPSTASWTVDTSAPPAPTFGSVPASVTNATAASLAFSDADGSASFTCAWDGATPTACASPASLSGLSAGAHTFVVHATDAAGNTSSASYSWTVDLTAPKATSTATTTLTGATTVLFTEPVLGVSTSTVALRVSGTTTNLALLSLVCKSGSSTVSCSGPVTSAVLTPKAALVPGQTYLPYVASTVHDPAGNSAVSSVTSFRALLSAEENSPAVAAAWKSARTKSAYGGSYIMERRGGAAVTYKFASTSVTWYTVTGPDQGYADVYIDNIKKATINNYATSRHYHVARTWSGFTNAPHTIKIVAENKRSSGATNSYVSVDAIKVGSTMYNSPSPLAIAWSRVGMTSASGHYVIRSDVSGAAVSMTFKGTSVRWYTMTAADQGKAQVFIDGKLVSTIDNYSSSTKYGVSRTFGSLSNAVHTVRIVVLGQHRSGAKGSLVSIDRFVVG